MYNFIKYKRNWKRCLHCDGKLIRISQSKFKCFECNLVWRRKLLKSLKKR